MLTVSHPTGNTFVRALLDTFAQREMLAAFYTTLAVQPWDWPVRLIPTRFRRQLERRAYAVSRRQMTRYPQREAMRHMARILHLQAMTRHETGWASVDAVYSDLDRRVARALRQGCPNAVTGVYCYEDCALQTFQSAGALGLTRFYDLPIAYWETARRLLDDEVMRWPEWEPTLVGTRDSPAKLARKTEELALADVVLTPSRFVYNSLPAEVRAQKACYVVEFGSPDIPAAQKLPGADPTRPLRILFAGSMTQRKGLADLFAAVKILKRTDVELVVMGSPIAPLAFYQHQAPAGFRYEAPRPHADVLALMRSCDVFALPSIVEGRALVQQEALACGLPLLVTPNAGGEDLIEEGQTGFLVPIRSPEMLAEKIAWFADHRDALPQMRRNAMAKAAEYTWERYGNRIADIVKTHTGTEHHAEIG